MSMTREEMMGMVVATLPTEELTLSNGKTVTIQALKGLTSATIASKDDMGDQIFATLKDGLIEPSLNNKDLRNYIDYCLEDSTEIFAAITKLSNVLVKAEEEEKEDIKKN